MYNFTRKLTEYGLTAEVYYKKKDYPLELQHFINANLYDSEFRTHQEAGEYNELLHLLLLNNFCITVDEPNLFIQKLGFKKYADEFSSLAFYNAKLVSVAGFNGFSLAKRSCSDDYYHNAFKFLMNSDEDTSEYFAHLKLIRLFDEKKCFSLFRDSLENKRTQLFNILYNNEYAVLQSLYNELVDEIKYTTESIVSKESVTSSQKIPRNS